MRNATILIIAAVLIALVIVEHIFIQNTFSKLETDVASLQSAIAVQTDINTTENLAQITALVEYWDAKEDIMCLTMNHKDLDRIGEQINKLKTFISENDKEYALYEMHVLQFYIDSYQKVTSVSFKNIA